MRDRRAGSSVGNLLAVLVVQPEQADLAQLVYVCLVFVYALVAALAGTIA